MFVDRNHPLIMEHTAGELLAEAAEMGFPVGRWPAQLTTNLGNGYDLILAELKRDQDGDIQAAIYKQQQGSIKLTVFK